jgi:hypothetical protein
VPDPDRDHPGRAGYQRLVPGAPTALPAARSIGPCAPGIALGPQY